eukprot:243234_1
MDTEGLLFGGSDHRLQIEINNVNSINRNKRKRPSAEPLIQKTEIDDDNKQKILIEPPRKKQKSNYNNNYVHIETLYHPSKPVWKFHKPKVCLSYRPLNYVPPRRCKNGGQIGKKRRKKK